MFSYPEFKNNVQTLSCVSEGINAEMLMDVYIHKIAANSSIEFFDTEQESAFLILKGKLHLEYEGQNAPIERSTLFFLLPSCLHVAKGVKVKITAIFDSELLVQKTKNQNEFKSKLYLPNDISFSTSCANNWEGVARRDVVTVFDFNNAPYSNIVLGEIFVPQGHWFSYIPHSHPQPELYYYRLHRPEGFGACFIDEDAYTIKDGSAGAFLGGKTHSQVTAPGYPMYCCWMIRHLDGNPWKQTRLEDNRFSHLLKE